MGLTHAKAGEVVNVLSLKNELERSRATALVKTKEFQTIRMCIDAGQDIPEHKTRGPLTVQCLEGKIEFTVGQVVREMQAGDWLFLEAGQLHSLRGLEDSALLLTLVFPSACC